MAGGKFDAADLVVEALGRESVDGAAKWSGARKHAGGAEEIAARGINKPFNRGRRGGGRRSFLGFRAADLPEPVPNPFGAMDDFYGEKREQCARKPQPREHGE
jgi:hypothetical protein